jgi:HEAT repeat protein
VDSNYNYIIYQRHPIYHYSSIIKIIIFNKQYKDDLITMNNQQPIAKARQTLQNLLEHKTVTELVTQAQADETLLRIVFEVFKNPPFNQLNQIALTILFESKNPLSVELLLTLLHLEAKGTWEVTQAIKILGEMTDERSIEPLILMLKHQTSLVRADAIEALQKIGDSRAIEPLLQLFNDIGNTEYINENPDRFSVDKALAYFGGPSVFEFMLNVLQAEITYNQYSKESAAKILGQLQDVRAFEPLVTALDNDNPIVRNGALRGLGNLGDKRAFPLLTIQLAPTGLLGASAIIALGDLGDSRAVEWLLPMLQDENPITRKIVVIALGKLKDRRVVAPLLAQLKQETKERQISVAILEALKKVDPMALRPVLIQIIQEQQRMLLGVALRALGQTKDYELVPILLPLLKHKDPGIRLIVIEILEQWGDRRTLPALRIVVQEGGEFMRKSLAAAAIKAIRSIEGVS